MNNSKGFTPAAGWGPGRGWGRPAAIHPAAWLLAAGLSLAALAPLAAQPLPDADTLLDQADAAATFATLRSEGRMILTDSLGTRTVSYRSWARGRDDTLIEFTSPAERGQKVLRTASELYLYFPDSDEVLRLQGAALRQSLAGSDLSYEDMTGNRNRRERYEARLIGAETLRDRPVWRLELSARGRNIPYPKQEIWLDQELNIILRGRYYALSGRLLKELDAFDVRRFQGVPLATRLVVSDKLRSNTSTEMRLETVEINGPVDPKLWTLENLSF